MLIVRIFLLFAVVLFAFGYVVLIVSYTVIPRLKGDAPYVVSANDRVERMIRLAGLALTDRVIDLGSGDGRLVFASARAGVASAVGVEIHPALVWRSRIIARFRRLRNATFVCGSFWETPLADVDVVFVYQLPRVMEKLAEKFRRELPDGARIVSNAFLLPGWTPVAEEGNVRLYIHRRNA